MDFIAVAHEIHKLACTTSTREKEGLLRRGASLQGYKDILKHIYNPYITTGIKAAKLENMPAGYLSSEICEPTPEFVLEYFSTTRTGDSYDVAVALNFIEQYEDPIAVWLATGIVTKDLQCGVSTTTLNNVFGKSFIPRIGIMRGKQAPDSLTGTYAGIYIATEKIDGNRRLIFNFDDRVEMYTRSGRRDDSFTALAQTIHKRLPTGYVYDCEMTAVGSFKDNIELRQATTSLLSSQQKNKTGGKLQCFDMVRIAQYNDGESTTNAINRKYMLAALFRDTKGMNMLLETGLVTCTEYADTLQRRYPDAAGDPLITALPILGVVKKLHQAKEIAKDIWDTGGEGLMLVDAVSQYKVSATPQRAWLKVKATFEYVAKVLDIYEGDNTFAGMMGGVEVAFLGPDGHAHRCKVGSGFTVEQRVYYFDHPEELIGKIIECDCFGPSRARGSSSYSLNCPVFKRIQGEIE